ncbi:MAG: DUF1573 domain-containing protein [Dehalococcoidia bacterium]|jgi:hypothetical protein|nr:DUF1573 domain-containing protein [Dehalococcoidia bacterium]
MKRIVLISSVIVILLVTVGLAVGLTVSGGNEALAGQSVILFDQESVNVGNVSPGVALVYSFNFTNGGDAPLIVEDVDIKTLEGC